VVLRGKRRGSKRGEKKSGWREEENLGISVESIRSEENRVPQRVVWESVGVTAVDLMKGIEREEVKEL